MAEEIRTRFKSVRLHNHWPCTVCGGQTSGVNVLNESPDGTVRVCEHCLQAGHIDERLAIHAQQLEEQAQKTRSLIGRLKVPTYEEWIAEEERVDAERIAEGEEPY
jgi:ribosome-binding protein aMBF1 (putative translation factor)